MGESHLLAFKNILQAFPSELSGASFPWMNLFYILYHRARSNVSMAVLADEIAHYE